MDSVLQLEEPKSLKIVIANEIRKCIILGRFKPGEQLSDKVLAQELQTSRTPVREALLQLQSEGLVVVRPQRGTFVTELNREEIRQICELRAIFEAGALPIAAARGVEALVTRLSNVVAKAAFSLEANDFNQCEQLDTEFHESIIELSGNNYLIESYRRISEKVRTLRHRLPQSRDRVMSAIAGHRKILDLVATHRVNDATRELASHVQTVQRLLSGEDL
jgi:DNA-binding GntR family transcriptional regulator